MFKLLCILLFTLFKINIQCQDNIKHNELSKDLLTSYNYGQATYTNPTNKPNKCSLPNSNFYTGVSLNKFKNSQICGTCLTIINTQTNLTINNIKVIDQCSSCEDNDLNLSKSTYNKLFPDLENNNNLNNELLVKWKSSLCTNLLGNIKYYWQKGSNKWFGAIQIRNHNLPILSVDYKFNNNMKWINMKRRDDNYFIIKNIKKKFIIRVNAINGESLVDYNLYPINNGGIVVGKGQFSGDN